MVKGENSNKRVIVSVFDDYMCGLIMVANGRIWTIFLSPILSYK